MIFSLMNVSNPLSLRGRRLRCLSGIVWILCFWALLPLKAMGEAMPFGLRQISTQDGLPNSMIHQVLQDEKGFMWMATFYGLYRYDGYGFRAFKAGVSSPSFLPDNNVICMQNVGRKLWLGTHGGLCVLDKATNRVRCFSMKPFEKKRVNDIFVSSSHVVYAGCIQGLAYYDAAKGKLVVMTPRHFRGQVPYKVNVQALCEDAHGNLIIATWANGLYLYKVKSRTFVHYPDVMGCRSFLSLFKDSSGTVWLGSNGGGFFKLSFGKDGRLSARQYSSKNTALSSDYVYALNEQRSTHTLWIGTRNGIALMNMRVEGQIRAGNSIGADDLQPTAEVTGIYRDTHDRMWVTTKGAGIFYTVRRWHVFEKLPLSAPAGQKADIVQAIEAEPNGALWCSFAYGVVYKKGSVRTELLTDKRVNNIFRSDKTGLVFLSTHNGGVYECKDGKVLRQYNTSNSPFIPNNMVNAVAEDRGGNLWIASYGGLAVRYANGKGVCFRNIIGSCPLLRQEITSVMASRDGTLWLTVQNMGVVHLFGNLLRPKALKYKIYDVSRHNLPVNTALGLFSDHLGRLWLGTEGCGLCVYSRKEDCFRSVHEAYHLPGDMVSSLQEDAQGRLWLGTNQGLARLDFRDGGKGVARVYTVKDGLADNFFEQGASCRQGGMLYFGTPQGVVAFASSQIKSSYQSHQALITEVLINGQSLESLPLSIRKKVSLLTPDYIQRLVIPASVKDFTIRFAAFSAEGASAGITYAYRLVGYDNAWKYAIGQTRDATYTNLDPGEYTFELKATDGEGHWSKVKAMRIVVKPPFYATPWAYAFYVLLVLMAALWAIQKARKRMMLHNKLQLQVTDTGMQVVLNHQEEDTPDEDKKKLMVFEMKDLDYTDSDEQLLREAFKCINQHLSDADYGTAQLVADLNISRTTLFKKLKSLTGMNASGLIRSVRLKAAGRLLDANPNARVSDVAYQVGFNDPKYFSICFKKEFGKSPKDYVEKR